MATITIGGKDYASYSSVDDADDYLAADLVRGPLWSSRTEDQKKQGLVTATRFLQRLSWASGAAPSTDDPVASPLPEATAMLASDMLENPDLASGAGTGSNVKRAKAGSAEVEFFRPVAGLPFTADVWALLGPLLGSGGGLGASYGLASGTDQCSHFDPTGFKPGEAFR